MVSLSRLGGGQRRRDDMRIGAAAAEVAADRRLTSLGRWIGHALQQRRAAHHHAGRAEAALQGIVLDEGSLNRCSVSPWPGPRSWSRCARRLRSPASCRNRPARRRAKPCTPNRRRDCRRSWCRSGPADRAAPRPASCAAPHSASHRRETDVFCCPMICLLKISLCCSFPSWIASSRSNSLLMKSRNSAFDTS
jgi:hypothetical protein